MAPLPLVACLLVASSCRFDVEHGYGHDAAEHDADGPTSADAVGNDAAPAGGDALAFHAMYANTETELYWIDPATGGSVYVGTFNAGDSIGDLAVDRDGRMMATTFTSWQLYQVDPASAACAYVGALAHQYVGLTFAGLDLLGTTFQGEVYRIDPVTAAETLLGSHGGGLLPVGDVISIEGVGTYATVTGDLSSTSQLASIDSATGTATVIGDTGKPWVRGLGWWEGELFGYGQREVMTIDRATAAATTRSDALGEFWGAAGSPRP